MLASHESILVDSRTTIWLHARSRANLLKLLLSRLDIYLSALSAYEVAAAFIYYRIGDPRNHIARLEKIYHIIYPDREILSTAARISADLMYHGESRSDIDVIIAATAISRNLLLVSVNIQEYEVFKKYGLSTLSMEGLIKQVEHSVEGRVPPEGRP
ncbi:MAG: hypothetical protein F7B18_05085 [Desulfurococcales archaeon]|nr:hypothetical protein [Desulfurococcales archaeon]